jgi:hypothetical protein
MSDERGGWQTDEMKRSNMNTVKRTQGIGKWIAMPLIIALLLVLLLALFLSRFPGNDVRYPTVFTNTAKVIEVISRMRINLLKSIDLGKAAVMSITTEESRTLADQSRTSADAVERDYAELKVLIDAANIGNEIKLLKEFSDNWNNFRVINRELLSLAVENSNIKAANLSYTAAAQAMGYFEQRLSALTDLPKFDHERAQMARLAYQAVASAFVIYSLEAPHINEAEDKKMDELENLMAVNERKVRDALRNIALLTDRQGRIIFDEVSSAFSKFMEVNKEVVRLSRMNTNLKSQQLSLGRMRTVAAQCEAILNSFENTVQSGRTLEATK